MFEKIANLIDDNDDFVLTSHVNPDGDSIGSELALYTYIINKGKKAKVINYSETPSNYVFLDEKNVIEKFEESKHRNDLESADVIVVLDTNEYSRLRTMEPYIRASKAKKICIDHHLGDNSKDFNLYFTDVESPATGEILYRFFTETGRENSINYDVALSLYTAIMTDTGSFRFERTTPYTHRAAASLIEKGVDPFKVYSRVYNESTEGKLKLLARFLNNIKTEYEEKLVYSTLRQKDFEDTGTVEMDTDGFSANLMTIATVALSIVILETPRGIKLSFRSNDNIYSNELAREFQGGGHKNAAGAFVPGGSFERIRDEVIEKSKKYIYKTK